MYYSISFRQKYGHLMETDKFQDLLREAFGMKLGAIHDTVNRPAFEEVISILIFTALY